MTDPVAVQLNPNQPAAPVVVKPVLVELVQVPTLGPEKNLLTSMWYPKKRRVALGPKQPVTSLGNPLKVRNMLEKNDILFD